MQQSQAWRTVPPPGVARCRDRDVRTVIAAVQAAYSSDPVPTTGDWSEASALESRPGPQDLSSDGPGEGWSQRLLLDISVLSRNSLLGTAVRQLLRGPSDRLDAGRARPGRWICWWVYLLRPAVSSTVREPPSARIPGRRRPAHVRYLCLGVPEVSACRGRRFALRLLCGHRRGAHSPRDPQSAPGTWRPRLPFWVGAGGR